MILKFFLESSRADTHVESREHTEYRECTTFRHHCEVADLHWLALPGAAVEELEDIEKTLRDGRATTEASSHAAAPSSCSAASFERGRSADLMMP